MFRVSLIIIGFSTIILTVFKSTDFSKSWAWSILIINIFGLILMGVSVIFKNLNKKWWY